MLLRLRPDKSPLQCTLDQIKQKKADLMKALITELAGWNVRGRAVRTFPRNADSARSSFRRRAVRREHFAGEV